MAEKRGTRFETFETSGGLDAQVEFEQEAAKLRSLQRASRRLTDFDDVLLRRNDDDRIFARASSPSLEERRANLEDEASAVLDQLLRKAGGGEPSSTALQINTGTMRIFLETGGSLSIIGVVLLPFRMAPIVWAINQSEILIDHIRYRCIVEVPDDLAPISKEELKADLDPCFEGEFQAAKEFAPRLRRVLSEVEAYRMPTSAVTRLLQSLVSGKS